jgi:shikimate kinase/3-dehydroquinate synthase
MQQIFLTGLSGSGKSTVGRRVAELLRWDFIDTDMLLSERCGMPVGQVLVEYGEQRFRQMESEVLISATDKKRVVIATGGGVVISEANRAFMREQGLTVYLETSVETAWQRVQEQILKSGNDAVRPLIGETNGQQRLQDLFDVRKQWYEQATLCINTDKDPPDIVSRRIAAFAIAGGYLSSSLLPQETITLQLGKITSQAVVGWSGLRHLSLSLQAAGFSKRVFIITDSDVGLLYIEPIQDLLAAAGFVPLIFTIPAGESSKSLQHWQQIIDWLVEQKADHQEAIVALGGGVVGDLAGFVAATYHRGVPLIHVPTSLLAQVDSAVGGKTGINHPLGKNLIGAFYQPRLIIVDPSFLLTLSERVYFEGWAEIVKYGMILDADLFEMLEEQTSLLHTRDAVFLSRIITRCVQLKMDIVRRDERDGGLRNILNYGHTFGHALEAITEYETWLHGEAVAIGMEVAGRIAVARGLLTIEQALRQHKLLQALHLPVSCPGIDIESVMEKMQHDKKVRARRTRWVLPTKIGHAEVYDDIPIDIVRNAIAIVCNMQ